jgi:quinol monooxygenase YgiN
MSDHIRLRAPVKIKDGRYDEFREACEALAAGVREKDPGTVSYSAYVNAETGEGYFIEHYENSDAMLAHFANAEPLFPPIFDICEVLPTEVYGNPSQAAREALESFETQPMFVAQIVDTAA